MTVYREILHLADVVFATISRGQVCHPALVLFSETTQPFLAITGANAAQARSMLMTAAAPGTLTAAEITARIFDPETPPADLAEILTVDQARSHPFRPHFTIRRDLAEQTAGGAQIADGIPALIRRGRQRRYAERIAAGWQGPRLVVDGDSWFQFPLVRDLYHQLDRDHAVHCLSGEGDPLHNPIRRQQICDAIVELRPDAVVISAGGSDVLDGFRFPAFIERYSPGRAPIDYLTAYYSAFLYRELMPRITGLLIACRAIDPHLPILLHSYAHAFPRDFIWLGDPLHSLRIDDPLLRRQIIAAMIDRFHAALVRSISLSGLRNVHVVDCRDAVGTDWFDELHPNNRGFAQVARRFRRVLAKVV